VNQCAICDLPVVKRSVVEDGKSFCCTGCATVYKILSSKKVQGSFKEHPLFKKALASGIINNPTLVEEKEVQESKTLYFEIGKMWCASCAYLIELVLLQNSGVLSCNVDYATDIALIEYDPKQLGKAKLREYITSFGYEVGDWTDVKEKKNERKSLLHFCLGIVLFFYLMMFAYPLYISSFGGNIEGYEQALAYLSFVLSLPIIGYLSLPLWHRVRLECKVRQFGVNSLVMLGVFSAFFYSTVQIILGCYDDLYFDSMAAVIAGLFLGRYLQARAKVSVKDKMLSLERFIPRRARIKEGATTLFVPLKEVKEGDIIAAFSGEKIVLDGIVCKGEATLDEAMLTGELAYSLKKPGDEVTSGTHLKGGTLEYRVTKALASSTLSQLVGSIERSLQKGGDKPWSHRFLHYFVLAVLVLSGGTFLYTGDFLRALSVLLIFNRHNQYSLSSISCPFIKSLCP
jgi:cation transport ATPase